MTAFADRIKRWYLQHGRDLPWRQTRDPYRILVSEIMLQQTQVDRVLSFYAAFLHDFPDAACLAQAPREAVLARWQGLGYPSRAERLQKTCQIITHEHDGVWPTTPDGLQALPGIGPYTAGAVACFAFAQPVPVVDTNIARVLCRHDDLPVPPETSLLWQTAANHVPLRSAIPYHNAMMDLGATICTAAQAHCHRCPVAKTCAARSRPERQQATGNPLKVATKKHVYGNPRRGALAIVLGLIHDDAGRYLVARRPASAHAGGSWELPGGKREKSETDREALRREIREETGLELLSARPFCTIHHSYEDRAVRLSVFRCRIYDASLAQALASDEIRWVTPDEFLALDFPEANTPIQQRLAAYHKLPLPA